MINNRYINNKIFNEEIEDSLELLEEILFEMTEKLPNDNSTNNSKNKIEEFKAIQVINAFCKNHNISLVETSNLSTSASYNQFRVNLNSRLTKLFSKDIETKYDDLFKNKLYKFNKEELKKVQNMINKLRDKVNEIEILKEKHKARIIKKLNEMQTELNKPISTFDTLIGKSVVIINTMRYGRKEVIEPIMNQAIDLTKELNKFDGMHNAIPDTKNQLSFEEAILIEEEAT